MSSTTAYIGDHDGNGSQEDVLRGDLRLSSDELIPGREYERTISDRDGRGFADVTVRIEVLPVGP
jgi:hypothetical protein